MTAQRQVRGALLLYHRPAFFNDASTITDHIEAFGRYSRFPFWKLNTDAGFPRRLAGLRFDAIIVHYSVFASGPFPYLLDDGFLDFLARAESSYKLTFFQDEHQYCQKRFAFLNRFRFDCVYTCLQPEYFDATYRRYTQVPELVSHVPAYVHPEMVATAERLQVPDRERRVDVGYRARPNPPYCGRGGMEKTQIGERFAEHARGTGLTLDITAREQDRLYGDDWYRFMAGCRGFLGTESGASCVDLEDEVRKEYERLSADGREVTIEDLERGSLGRWDWKVPLRTISSRHFEAAALEVCQLMYEGHYSGTMKPMEHYIPLRKDFSNFDQAVELFRDESVRRELTENAYRDLIASGAHSYERFIAGFDQKLEEAGLSPGEQVSAELVRREMRGRPARRLAARFVSGGFLWLNHNHPALFKVLWPLFQGVYYASRPVVVPLRAASRLARRGRPAPAR